MKHVAWVFLVLLLRESALKRIDRENIHPLL